jgi:hypothetical protein
MNSYISPATLVDWVRNTAPFLFETQTSPLPGRLIGQDFTLILNAVAQDYVFPEDESENTEDYFALCLAAHHGTVATFIPTDVDSKIRGLLWRDNKSQSSHRRMFQFAQAAMLWPMDRVSRRYTTLASLGPVSGHNGEQLSVLMGALQTFLRTGDSEFAALAESAVTEELRRQTIEFVTACETRGQELNALRLAAYLTHNVGDVDQGLSYWPHGEKYDPPRAAFGRLAHENTKPFGGAFADAARVYKKVMAPEGHRNYPLRSIKGLRQSADLLLPQAPFLDDWGRSVAKHPALSDQDRSDTLGALITGSRKLPGQRGYYRAIHGMLDILGHSGMQKLLKLQSNSVRKEFEDPELRKLIAVSQESFESSMRKAFHAAFAR